MSKKDVLEWFAVNSANLSGSKIVLLMLLGIVIGIVIYLTYKLTYQGVSYSAKFNSSNVVILLITVVIMLMISSNVVISLGMVGALSIVRFRTAVKDPRDTVFIFWAIVEGLCVGSQNIKLTLVSTIVIALVITAFSLIGKKRENYVLVIRGNKQSINMEELNGCIQSFTVRSVCKSVNTAENDTELVYEVKAKENLDLTAAEKIKGVKGVQSVHFLLEAGNILG